MPAVYAIDHPFFVPDWPALPDDPGARRTAEHNRDVFEAAMRHVIEKFDEAEAAGTVRILHLRDGGTAEIGEHAVIIALGIIVGRITQHVIAELPRVAPFLAIAGPQVFQGVVNTIAAAIQYRKRGWRVSCVVERSTLQLVRTTRRQAVDVTPVLAELEQAGWLPSLDASDDFVRLCSDLFEQFGGQIPPSPFRQALALCDDPEAIEERAAILEADGVPPDMAERAAIAAAPRRPQ